MFTARTPQAVRGGILAALGLLLVALSVLLSTSSALAAAADSPVLTAAASRKAHAAAGTFDLPLSLTLTNPTTEPRSGPTHTVVFVFDKPVTAGTATVTEGAAIAGTPVFAGNEMAVPLSGVANQQYVTIAVTNVVAADGGTGGAGSVRIGLLLGDVNGNRVVSLSDLGQVNAQIAQSVTAANFMKDVNVSGTLSLADKGIANTQVTKGLPAPPPPVDQPPQVNAGTNQSVTLPAEANLGGNATDDGLPGPLTLTWTKVSGPGTVGFANAHSAGTTATFSVAGTYVLRLTASDGTLSNADDLVVTVNPVSEELPPDPSTVAPPLDPTLPSGLADMTRFLYTGANPIQTGVDPAAIDLRRAGVLRGKVLDKNGASLTGVVIRIVAHPEFGQTRSRADGMFDMAVNGGGRITVRYEKPGYLPAQRQVQTFWQEFTVLPDVVLLQRDGQVTTINFGAGLPTMQVARGSAQSDADGTRQATVLFPPGTTAALVQPDGSTLPATTLNIRLTEYTVGPSGPQAMPGELPPTSGYTYAVELGADEAVAKVDGRDVVFNQPVVFYLENFLGLPVGEIVPIGYYDPARSSWVGAPNGRVIKVLGATAGMADLDVTGDGVADDAATLAALGITVAERQQLASLYPAGRTLWRAPMDHFSTSDLNYSIICVPIDCGPPQETPPPPPPPNQCTQAGSIIGCERQTLGEQLSIAGTPFRLHYQSDRVPGRTAEQGLPISLATGGFPTGVQSTEVEILVAGQKVKQHLPVGAGSSTSFAWDGKDVYGRPLTGSHPATVRVGYTYKIVVSRAITVPSSWARFSGIPFDANPGRGELTLWQERQTRITRLDQRGAGLGGWSLNELHAYDPAGRVLDLGDGTRREVDMLSASVARTFAGNGVAAVNGEGVPATQSPMSSPQGIAFGPDGSLYIADNGIHRVLRVAPDGTMHTFAGTNRGYSGDGGPANQAQLALPQSVAVGPDGVVYISDTSNFRVRRVGLDGIITTIVGTGVSGSPTEGGLANQQRIAPRYLAVGPDGRLYISDATRIWVIDQNGVINAYAGSGGLIFGGDGGPALQAGLQIPEGMTFAPDGTLFFVDGGRIRKVTPQGIITTVAGSALGGFSGDGGPATSAGLGSPNDVAVGRDGSLYIGIFFNRVRRVGPNGIITTFAGNGAPGYNGEGSPGPQTGFSAVAGVAIGPDGAVYVAGNQRVRRIGAALPGASPSDLLVPSTDGAEVYVFNGDGRHLRTLDALTGGLRYQFGYDAEGYPIAVTDGDGIVTTIERNGALPTAIVAPGGQRTTLATNGDGWLTQLTNPASESRTMEYSADGLLQRLIDPRGNAYVYTYDALGRLVKDEDPGGGSTTIQRTEQANGYTVTAQTALGRTRSYQVESLGSGSLRRTVVDPSGATTVSVLNADGTELTTDPTGSVEKVTFGADPRWGMLAPTRNRQITTPGGLTRNVVVSRVATLADPANPFSLTKLTETTSDNNHVSTSVYDAAPRTITETTPVGRKGTITLDALGRVTKRQVNGLEATTYAYTPQGLLNVITDGSTAPRTTTLNYNAARDLTEIVDTLARTEHFSYDAVGRVTGDTLTDGQLLGYAYDAAGNVTTVTPPGRPAHGFAFTPVDLQSAYVPPNLGSGSTQTLYVYNTERQSTQASFPSGRSIARSYDGAGRLQTLTIARGSANYGYDPTSGYLTSIAAPGAIGIGYTYDAGLLLTTSWTGPVAGTVARTYDINFRVTALSVGGSPIALSYDSDGLLTQAGALTVQRSAQTGLVSGSTLGNTTDSWTYNVLGERTAYTARYSGAPVFVQQFTRDQLGRIVAKSETIGGITDNYAYTYDVRGRLSAVTKNASPAASYAYDGNDNRLSITNSGGTTLGTYDAQDRLTLYGGTAYTYTADGDLTGKTVAGQTTSYAYDEIGNLTTVTLPTGTAIAYLVDGMNRRIGRKVDGTLTQGFLYQDTLKPAAELDGSGNVVARFVYATRRNVPDYMIKGNTTYRIYADHLGSPRLVIDVATGTVAQELGYDEFGNVTKDTNPGFQPFGYAGGLYDRDTKLVRFGARDYDAAVGRWTLKDPIGLKSSDVNLYSYASGDPLNRLDAFGLADCFSEAEAARRGLNLSSCNAPQEQGGWIYKDKLVDGKQCYAFTLPEPTTEPGGGKLKGKCPKNKDCTALYHTHQTGPQWDPGFSPTDIQTSKEPFTIYLKAGNDPNRIKRIYNGNADKQWNANSSIDR